MTDEERQEARAALIHAYQAEERAGSDAIRLLAGYLETDDPSYAAVRANARGEHGTVDREDMMAELLTSYLEKKTNSEIGEALSFAYQVMEKAGLRAVDQLAGYLLNDELSYIVNRENARNILRKIGRHDLMMELLTSYFES